MGQAVRAAAASYSDVEVVGLVDQGDDPATVIDKCDVVVDFSVHTITRQLVELCASCGKAMVIGTTGHSEAERQEILQVIKPIPVVWSSNFSTGVNVLFWLVRRTTEILGPEYDVEIVELHHRMKKDAPSGTAKTLAEVVAQAKGLDSAKAVVHGRVGIVGERPPDQIGVHAVRAGDIVGEHIVLFGTMGERLELRHAASSRETFARGALRAARWVVSKPPGVYTMLDVLGLK
jgi:4-hydroxy-tetrahydrodipicolinate reductase